MTPDPKKGIHFITATELPYLSSSPSDGRKVLLTPYYDPDRKLYYVYQLHSGEQILALPGVDLTNGTYLAEQPVRPGQDVHLPLSDTIAKYLSFDRALRALEKAEKDLINGLCSLHKYFVLLHHANAYSDYAATSLIQTEVEYLFGNHRSFYDLVHEIMVAVYSECSENPTQMSDSFERLTKKSIGKLNDNYRLPLPIAEFYKQREPVFMLFRYLRNNIIHHGHSPDQVFLFPDGFAISIEGRTAEKLAPLNLWPESVLKPNELGSLLAVFAYVVKDMFDTMDHLGESLMGSFDETPDPIIGNHNVYLRSRVSYHLARVDEYLQTQWFDPTNVLHLSKGD